MSDRAFLSLKVEQALRLAALAHAGQVRRASDVPYVAHAFAVAWILGRAGFGEDTVVAGLLHDVVEDTPVTLEEIESRFGPVVAAMVSHCTEQKTDAQGRKRPGSTASVITSPPSRRHPSRHARLCSPTSCIT